ncbi:hypothetical protein N8I77_000602 [Diaporthe amygdali]|uniref:Uncharacterized protein n=1 Tax=Phomopsis amygdali TaxID=1214568 RepID=A0AAD9W7C6_PHOAM|nr:hypothetical protein N8I77_000602 [Diaporthe amygdali]
MKLTPFLALLSVASGLVTPRKESNIDDLRYKWLLWNFHYNGDEGGDVWFFNITNPTAFPIEPLVNADCEIVTTWLWWQPCSILSAMTVDGNQGVWVLPQPKTDTINFRIMHSFTIKSSNPHKFYNVTGNFNKNWQGVTYPVNTTVYPSDVSLTKHWI